MTTFNPAWTAVVAVCGSCDLILLIREFVFVRRSSILDLATTNSFLLTELLRLQF